MKKLLFVSLFAFVVSSSSVQPEVYVCKGSGSKRYHKSENCRGLNNCSTKIYKVSKSEAEQMKRTPCKIEYK